jgi:hypothetical protein
MLFTKGERVKYNLYGTEIPGTVLETVNCNYDIPVQFDYKTDDWTGHSCYRLGVDGYCWYCMSKFLIRIEDKKQLEFNF